MSQFSKTRYSLIGLGGTFDHFHSGHEFFLTFAAENAFSLLIGVSTQKMIRSKKYTSTIQPYAARVKQVRDFCIKKGIQHQIIPLDNPYGPTLDNESKVKALCVTKETQTGAEKINQIRVASNLRPLPVFVANMVYDNQGHELHADMIRAGKVSRSGYWYETLFEETIVVNEIQKTELKRPLDKIIHSDFASTIKQKIATTPKELPICVVGDRSLHLFKENSIDYNLGIFDGIEKRQPTTDYSIQKNDNCSIATNRPGEINKEAVLKISQILRDQAQSREKQDLYIEGEEDLLTAALLLILPLHSRIYYGQPNQGMVELLVTEQLKNRVLSLFKN